MASSYFTLPSFARAKKNQEDLEKTNPQAPVLNDDDEKFLNKQISTDEAAQPQQDGAATAIKIADDGKVKEVSKEEAGGDVVVPETQPDSQADDPPEVTPDSREVEQASVPDQGKGSQVVVDQGTDHADGATESTTQPSYDDKLKEKAAEAKQARKAKKDKGFELPSQEEAEASTRRFGAQLDEQGKSQGEKRTWASYLASMRPVSQKGENNDNSKTEQTTSQESSEKAVAEGESSSQPQVGSPDQQQRTWKELATSYVPTIPTIPTTWKFKKNDPDAQAHPVYNEDGTINEEATKQQQEREVSVLLDNLNLSSINNRVFPLTQETQKYYDRFAQCLKDVINGVPTAYDDMDTLMREAGPRLEEQFKSMPPFVQTLVKSLPAKMGGIVGPELLAVASEKPGNDMKARMEAASRPGTADSGINIPMGTASEKESGKDGKEVEKKSKRRIPTLKSLVGEKSAVAGILRSTVTFIQTRFPFLASTTNVVMSLAVFILMFVFWYCHKRGREVRLEKEAADADTIEDGTIEEVEDSDDEDVEVLEKGVEDHINQAETEKDIDEKANILSQPDPTNVPLPSEDDQKAVSGAVKAAL